MKPPQDAEFIHRRQVGSPLLSLKCKVGILNWLNCYTFIFRTIYNFVINNAIINYVAGDQCKPEKKNKSNAICCVLQGIVPGYVMDGGSHNVSFHKPPKDKQILKQWIHNIRRDPVANFEITQHTQIYSTFSLFCYHSNLQKTLQSLEYNNHNY